MNSDSRRAPTTRAVIAEARSAQQQIASSKSNSTLELSKVARNLKPLPQLQSDLSVAPELAATVVRQYLLPLFETEHSPRRQPSKPLEVVSNTVYGELKLADSLLSEYTSVKQSLDSATQKLKDTEQEKARVLSELSYLKNQYSQVTSEIESIQNEIQESLRNQQVTDLGSSFIQNQMYEYKKLYALSDSENKRFMSDLHEEKALNDKRKNIAAELEHGNELLKMENDIMAERLTGLYAEFSTLAERRFIEDKLMTETDTLARSLEKLAFFCNTLSNQLVDAMSEREQLKSQHDQIEVLTEEIKAVRDRLLACSRDAINDLQKELEGLVEQREEYRAKQSKLEKNYKDLAEAYDKLRNRLKQWKQRGKNFKEHEEKICSKCRQAYIERENFNWSCKTHAGTYSAHSDMWWCCGRKRKDAIGCQPSKHVCREDEEHEGDEFAQGNREDHLGILGVVCSSCKETGHKPHECPKDPNVRTVGDPIEDDERVEDIRKHKKLNGNKVNSTLMSILGAKMGDTAFGDAGVSSESDECEVEQLKFSDIPEFKSSIRKDS